LKVEVAAGDLLALAPISLRSISLQYHEHLEAEAVSEDISKT
jgi:hypothetical protein